MNLSRGHFAVFVISKDSIIGGNGWLVHGVPLGSRVTPAQTWEEDFERGAGI
jgi:serine O-acetyltransferase